MRDAADFELKRFDQEAHVLRRMVLKTMATSSLITPMTQVVAAIGVSVTSAPSSNAAT